MQVMQYLAILGRQPDISLSELESLYPNQVSLLNSQAALVDTESIDFDRLGGTIKLAQVIASMPQDTIEAVLANSAIALNSRLPMGKLAIGLSLYGTTASAKDVFAQSLTLKKQLRAQGHSVRIVPGNQLTAAQIMHNHMISQGADLVIVSGGNTIYIGLTCAVQDIERYGLRDHGRPARSAKVGMLPPKLAQIMINLANPTPSTTVLDPFCGTGVILQEALLMNYAAYGSDIEDELISMSRQNLEWLARQFDLSNSFQLETGDATKHRWHPPIGAVVTEGYLGPALSAAPSDKDIQALASSARQLTLVFMANLRQQIDSNTPVCMTLPAWKKGNTIQGLNILDQIEALGYTSKQFSLAQSGLIYHRDNQFVARELVVLRSN